MEKAIPFWEEAYRSDNIMAFPIEPNKTVTEYEHLLNKDAAVLEASCSEGQNVLYLAKQGFHSIDAFDISEAGIAKLKKLCEVNSVSINDFVKDLAHYTFEKKYDLIMSFATLCFLEKSVWRNSLLTPKTAQIPAVFISCIFSPTQFLLLPILRLLPLDWLMTENSMSCITIGRY